MCSWDRKAKTTVTSAPGRSTVGVWGRRPQKPETNAADDAVIGQTITDHMATVAMMKSEPTQKVFTETKRTTQLT